MTRPCSGDNRRAARRVAVRLVLCISVITALSSPVPATAAVSIEDVTGDPSLHRGHSTVLRLYQAVLGRTPEGEGAQFWIDAFDGGRWDARKIAAHFAASDEFVAKYGPQLDNTEFTTVVYRNVLGRAPDNDGFVFWLDQLNQGMSRGEMILLISNAPEFIGANPLPSDIRPDTGPRGIRSPFCKWVADAIERHDVDPDTNWQILTGPEVERQYRLRAILVWTRDGFHFGGPGFDSAGNQAFFDLVPDYAELVGANAQTHAWLTGGANTWTCQRAVQASDSNPFESGASSVGPEETLDRLVYAWSRGNTSQMEMFMTGTAVETASRYEVVRARHHFDSTYCSAGSSGAGGCDVTLETTDGRVLQFDISYRERYDQASQTYDHLVYEISVNR